MKELLKIALITLFIAAIIGAIIAAIDKSPNDTLADRIAVILVLGIVLWIWLFGLGMVVAGVGAAIRKSRALRNGEESEHPKESKPWAIPPADKWEDRTLSSVNERKGIAPGARCSMGIGRRSSRLRALLQFAALSRSSWQCDTQ